MEHAEQVVLQDDLADTQRSEPGPRPARRKAAVFSPAIAIRANAGRSEPVKLAVACSAASPMAFAASRMPAAVGFPPPARP